MLQHDHLFEWRDIYKNVMLGLEINKQMTPEKKEKVLAMVDDYGLTPFLHKKPSELSGGLKQRAALVRTLLWSRKYCCLTNLQRPGLPDAPDRIG